MTNLKERRLNKMENIKLMGRIISTESGSEASLIIPIGEYRIMVLSDDFNGEGRGKIIRSELFVYHKDNNPSNNINDKIFDNDVVSADAETLWEAMNYCERKLRKSL
jgi:hypothetical protein